MDTEKYTKKARGLSLLSGGLDSQLAVCVLRAAGAEVEGVTFETPFFSAAAKKAGQFLQELWSVRATIFSPPRTAIPQMLFGVISLSAQGERHEWI